MANIVQSGFISLVSGANAALDPALLDESSYWKGLNLSSRKGLVRTRPSFVRIGALEAGKWQGCSLYRLNSHERFVYVIDGVVRSYNINTKEIIEHATFDTTDFDLAYFCKVDKFFVIQNGVDDPIILDFDAEAPYVLDMEVIEPDYPERRTRRGKAMGYGHGRMFAVTDYIWNSLTDSFVNDLGYKQIVAGDIYAPTQSQYSPLLFREDTEVTQVDAEGNIGVGGTITPSMEMGFISAIGFLRNSATGTGCGSLIVACRDGLASYSISTIRAQWVSFDFSQILFYGTGTGTISPWSMINVNDDLMYRGVDGLRSLRYSTTQLSNSSGALSCTPLSGNVEYILENDSEADLPFASMCFANNRVLLTTGGREDGHWRGLVSLDTAQLATMQAGVNTVYDGLWTGLDFLQVFTAKYNNKDECYIIAKGDNDVNELWVVDPSSTSESTLSRLYTKKYAFTSESVGVFDAKEFDSIQLWLKDITQSTRVTAYYRADGYDLWSKCTEINISVGEGSLPQSRYRVTLTPESLEEACANCDRITAVGSAFQFCIEFEGRATIESCRIRAHYMPEVAEFDCQEELDVVVLEEDGQLVLDDYTYEVTT